MLMDHCHIVIALHILQYIILSLYFLAQDHSVKTMHVGPQDRPCRPKQYRNNMRGTDHKAESVRATGARWREQLCFHIVRSKIERILV